MIVSHAALTNRSQVPDLRRRRTRDQVQRLVDRAERLDEPDRRLLCAVFGEGLPASRVARETRTNARLVRRRLRSVTKRVLDPRFDYVARHAEGWRPTRRRVATALYIRGLTMREAAAELGMSLYLVRLNRDAVEAMFEATVAARADMARG